MELNAVKHDNWSRLGLAQAGAATCRQVQIPTEVPLVLLVSDGVSDQVHPEVLARLCHEHADDPQLLADSLVAAATEDEGGCRDDATVVALLRVEGWGPPSFGAAGRGGSGFRGVVGPGSVQRRGEAFQQDEQQQHDDGPEEDGRPSDSPRRTLSADHGRCEHHHDGDYAARKDPLPSHGRLPNAVPSGWLPSSVRLSGW